MWDALGTNDRNRTDFMTTKKQPKRKAAARSTLAGGSDSSPAPSSPEWAEMHNVVSVMVEGRRKHIAQYLRQVADSIDMGCTSGMTGDANPARGRWIGLR